MLFRTLTALAAALILASCEETPSTDAPSAGQANRMERLIDASPSLSVLPQACPLAVYATKTRVRGEVPNCDRNPKACLALCESGNANACFDAARVVERYDLSNSSRAKYPLFIEACRLGAPNACVNAAATVKNGAWSVPAPAKAATPQCQFQTYDRMCKDGAPWGCYMRAQEYLNGDGYVRKSTAKYEASMREACRISKDSGACRNEFK